MKSYTDIEQSRKLAELLPLESADMWYEDGGLMIPRLGHIPKEHTDTEIPCWSLAALFDVLPNFIRGYGKCLYYDVDEYYCGYMVDGHFMLIAETKADNQIDACYEMIIRLHELKML